MPLKLQKARKKSDVVGATLSEIVLFLLFSCLILLGSFLERFSELGGIGDERGLTQLLQSEIRSRQKAEEELRRIIGALADAQGRIGELEKDKEFLETENQELRLAVRIDNLAVVPLSDDEGFRFTSGSSGLVNGFEDLLVRKLPELRADIVNAERRGKRIALEVIGHTDAERVISSRSSNLDLLPLAFDPNSNLQMSAIDNVGLGMARAVSVARALEKLKERPELSYMQIPIIIPLSAGPMVLPDGSRASGLEPGYNSERRRIELRLRELD